MAERRSDQVGLAKMREVKTRNSMIDFARYAQGARVSLLRYVEWEIKLSDCSIRVSAHNIK
jgi:hypothetical protein